MNKNDIRGLLVQLARKSFKLDHKIVSNITFTRLTHVFTYFYKFLRPQSLLEACVSYSRKSSSLVDVVEE